MRFEMIGRMDPAKRRVVGFGDRSTGGANFGGEYGTEHRNVDPHCNQ